MRTFFLVVGAEREPNCADKEEIDKGGKKRDPSTSKKRERKGGRSTGGKEKGGRKRRGVTVIR